MRIMAEAAWIEFSLRVLARKSLRRRGPRVGVCLPNDDTASVRDPLVENGVRDDRDADEHVAVPRNDRVLDDLGPRSTADRDCHSREVAESVVHDRSGQTKVSFANSQVQVGKSTHDCWQAMLMPSVQCPGRSLPKYGGGPSRRRVSSELSVRSSGASPAEWMLLSATTTPEQLPSLPSGATRHVSSAL